MLETFKGVVPFLIAEFFRVSLIIAFPVLTSLLIRHECHDLRPPALLLETDWRGPAAAPAATLSPRSLPAGPVTGLTCAPRQGWGLRGSLTPRQALWRVLSPA